MVKGIIGKKVGMTQLFDESGKVIPVTVIEAGPCTVVQKKTVESDGYQAVQLGFGEVSAKKVNKAAAGHFKKANVAPKKTLREFRLDDVSAMNVGDILKADVFAAGDKVDVAGVSKGKGYQGVIKRFGQHRLRKNFWTDFDRLASGNQIPVWLTLETSYIERGSTYSLWGLLVNSGYLTALERLDENTVIVRIPNDEVMSEFQVLITELGGMDGLELQQMFSCLLHRDTDRFLELYRKIVISCTSYLDAKENAYHMLFLGMCMTMRGIKKPGSQTITMVTRGVFAENKELQDRFLQLVNR